jgi:hypothetical protein
MRGRRRSFTTWVQHFFRALGNGTLLTYDLRTAAHTKSRIETVTLPEVGKVVAVVQGTVRADGKVVNEFVKSARYMPSSRPVSDEDLEAVRRALDL